MKTAGLMMAAVAMMLGGAGVAEAKGCVRGAIAGGVAGHVAGHHGLMGAAAGCVIARHHYAKKAKLARTPAGQMKQR
jgi:hypothetical protein